MGLLVAMGPLVLFFSSPLIGALSDQKGRKKMLNITLIIGFFSYLIAVVAIARNSLLLLMLSRIFYGISAGNLTVVQAALADLSSREEKAKYFGLYSMALGAGFGIGPFLGGILSKTFFQGGLQLAAPFCFAALLTFINWVLIAWKFKESRQTREVTAMNWMVGLKNLKRALRLKELRMIFIVMFLFFFGWDFFMEFASVFLLKRFDFSGIGIGAFYAYTSLLYALFAGIFIRPITKRFPAKRILEIALILGGCYFFFFLCISKAHTIWLYIPPLLYFLALIYPTATTVISNDAPPEAQGEILGVYGSIQSLALILSPFCASSFIGNYPFIIILVAGSFLFMAGISLMIFRLHASRHRI
jgi:MFS transporter, DHA1 family, tetracycline resistance protein